MIAAIDSASKQSVRIAALRCARQGDSGRARAFISLEGELIQRFVPAPMRKCLASAVRRQMPSVHSLAEAALTHAQRKARRPAYRQGRNVLNVDTWLEDALSFTGSHTEL